MKTAIKDYAELCKLSLKWMKKHWLFYILSCILIWSLAFIKIVGLSSINLSKIKSVFKKNEEEESE